MKSVKRKLERLIGNNFRDEIFTSNLLDKDVQSMVLPLNVMQIVVLNPKYNIKNDFITPNNILNKLILVCGAVIFLTAYVYRLVEILLDENMKRYLETKFLYFASCFDFSFCCLGFITNFFINFINSKANVKFILTFQEVHRFLHSQSRSKWFIINSWSIVAVLFVAYIMVACYDYFMYLRPPWHVTFNLVLLLALDSNLIYAIRLIKLLTDKVVLWNVQLLLSHENGYNETHCQSMFQAYVQILKCYEIYKCIFQIPVLYQTADIFFHGLVNIQVLIEFSKVFLKYHLPRQIPLIQGLLYAWMIKNLIIQISLNLCADAFYVALKNAQDSCELILSSNCRGEERKLCKNILRVHRATFSKMTACGLFYVDVCQPLRLLGLLTNYIVVLLQFAFM